MKKALILGSTGLIGSYVVEQLKNDSRYSKVILVNRRATHPTHPKVEEIVVDFNHLQSEFNQLAIDEVFCCIGTTIKKAGSRENFKAVDYAIPVQFGKIALRNKWPNFAFVSSLGADAKSSTFYTKVKGEVEEKLIDFGFKNLVIVRPSLLLGERDEFRFGERIAQLAFSVLGFVMVGPLKKYKAIQAKQVAKSMIYYMNQKNSKIIHENDELLAV
ncbi:NAD-dependent epimerase/dehydratase family protein [Acidiluteibacter ferrifornacis]|uniref:NAD-dependent epimerase/dehydratase family protein n=1 Tax=Acidiluteibacter ferrifornacis TaxID=2692424 RepID=A0A6N9NIC9_9FLAO|nr:NAD-dependent epimerase/dehydratase family protein [Acidiluteibacter ferrifornacis]NBG65582.1 NAD-dependent epimerase/dehydratase family protein [Acidiluteibacter ferrifornacis]